MNEYEVKDHAYSQQLGVLSAQQNANNYINQVVTDKATVMVEVINRLENLNGLLRDIIVSQTNLMERLHGSSPTAPSQGENVAVDPSGCLNTIDARLNWCLASAQKIQSNQMTFDRLA